MTGSLCHKRARKESIISLDISQQTSMDVRVRVIGKHRCLQAGNSAIVSRLARAGHQLPGQGEGDREHCLNVS